MNSSAEHSLQPYRGSWSRATAAQLMGRLGCGTSVADVDDATQRGLQATIDRYVPADRRAGAESDEFQATEPVLRKAALSSGDINQLKAWWLYRLRYSRQPLTEKVSLLWHNQFATSQAKVLSVPHMAAQHDLLRQHATGSFRELLHGMSRDVAMLIWLDSNSNRKRHPNENFARELLELFSLGVGNYTEKDIQEAARAFSGWHVREGEFWFNRNQHDEGSKSIFGKTANFDGREVVDLCLASPACPRFLAMKLLTTFVSPRPSNALRDSLAARIRQHDFQITPVLRELFQSEAFFAESHRMAIIKSPIELVIGTLKLLEVRPHFQNCIPMLANLGQDLFEPPSVKGWEGGTLWINSASLIARMNFMTEAIAGARFGRVEDSAIHALTRDLQVARDVLQLDEVALTDITDNRAGLHRLLLLPEFQMV